MIKTLPNVNFNVRVRDDSIKGEIHSNGKKNLLMIILLIKK